MGGGIFFLLPYTVFVFVGSIRNGLLLTYKLKLEFVMECKRDGGGG